MNSGNVSHANPRPTATVAQYPERRHSERRRSLTPPRSGHTPRSAGRRLSDLGPISDTLTLAPPTKHYAASIADSECAVDALREQRNAADLKAFNTIKRSVTKRIGRAGIDGIRGFSGLGYSVGTVAGVALFIASGFVPMLPLMGVVAFLGGWLIGSLIGATLQFWSRRKRMPEILPKRAQLVALREQVLREVPPHLRLNADEKDLILKINRLIADIDGGFWYCMRSAGDGLLDPTTMFRRGWATLFGRFSDDEKRWEKLRSKHRAEASVPSDPHTR